MSNTNTNLQTQTSNALHNAIIKAGVIGGYVCSTPSTVLFGRALEVLQQQPLVQILTPSFLETKDLVCRMVLLIQSFSTKWL
ncbi:hypothetical protein Tco_0345295 [Tanacetum coccineum]